MPKVTAKPKKPCPCKKMKSDWKAAQMTEATAQTALGSDPEVSFHVIHCGCGLKRLIPSGLKVDDIFELVPCPRCGTALKARYLGDQVEELL